MRRTEVEYEYDVHPPEPPEPNPYTTWSNRLMKYKTYSVTPAQQEMAVLGDGFETLGGGFWPPGGEQRVLQSTTYYYYNDSGNVERVVTRPNPNPSNEYSAVRLSYAYNERTVAFALGETWTCDGVNPPTNYHVTWAREFRYDGARQRYLNRVLDPLELEESNDLVEVSSVWSDYAGDAIHGDFAFSGGSFTELTSYEPGLAKVVDPLGSPATTYYHTNMIGTTRFMSDAAGSKIEPVVYTAFGERINGTNHRYGYAGAWGYQAHDEMPFLHVGHRYYDPATGRFLQRDPTGLGGGLNTYAYVWSKPTAGADPSGLAYRDALGRYARKPWWRRGTLRAGPIGLCGWIAVEITERIIVPAIDRNTDRREREGYERINNPRLPNPPPQRPPLPNGDEPNDPCVGPRG